MVADLVQRQVLEARYGAGLDRLSDVQAKIARAYRASRSEDTLTAYRPDWADFATWCETVGLEALPAAPGTVAGYLAELADPPDDRAPRAMSTIERRVAALGEAHGSAAHQNPGADPLVKQVVKGIQRQIGVAPKNRKSGLSSADVRAIVTEVPPRTAGSCFMLDPRRQAVLLVGGDKTNNWVKWYRTAIPEAEALYEDYLQELQALGVLADTEEDN